MGKAPLLMNNNISIDMKDRKKRSYAHLTSPIFPAFYPDQKIFFTILFSLYLALSFIRFVHPNFLITCMVLGIGLFVFILLSIRIKKLYIPVYLFTGFLVASFLISSIAMSRSQEGPRIVLHIVSCAGIAMLLLRGYVYSWGGYLVFYGLAGYFLTLIFSGVDAHYALTWSSWNGISMLILAASITLYIVLSIKRKEIDLIPALLALFISVWGIGRSGIISSVVLFSGLLLVKVQTKQKRIVMILFCLFVVFLFRENFLALATSYLRVENAIELCVARREAGYLAGRGEIWVNYFNNLNIFRVIFGSNVFTDPWPQKEFFAYNYHNSFIALHSKTGLMGLVTLAIILFSLINYFKVNKVFFVLFFVVVLRWSTDAGLFLSHGILYRFFSFFIS